MFKAPLYSALAEKRDKGEARFHMPGHKGRPLYGGAFADACAIDFTELRDTGNLYEGTGPIAEAETLLAEAWNAPHAYMLTGGSTQGVMAALLLAAQSGGRRVLCDRASHSSVFRAAALLDLLPEYIYPKYTDSFGIPSGIDISELDRALTANPDIKTVFITSPSYYGIISDIPAAARVAHRHGALLIVDEAHGAHLPFLQGFGGAVSFGADLAVCSLHKTLPALGQAAVLTEAGKFEPWRVREATSHFGTASPSYVIMASIDLARAYMDGEGRDILALAAKQVSDIRNDINFLGGLRALAPQDVSKSWARTLDPTRLVVSTAGLGLTGPAAQYILEVEEGIVPEMADLSNLVFIVSPSDAGAGLKRLGSALMALGKKPHGIPEALPDPAQPAAVRVLTPRETLFYPCSRIPLGEAFGKIVAAPLMPFPPGIPVVAPGEKIESAHIDYLLARGFLHQTPISVCDV